MVMAPSLAKGPRYRPGPRVTRRTPRNGSVSCPARTISAVRRRQSTRSASWPATATRRPPDRRGHGRRQCPLVRSSRPISATRSTRRSGRPTVSPVASSRSASRAARATAGVPPSCCTRALPRPGNSILIFVDPVARSLEIVTGADVRADPEQPAGRARRDHDAVSVRHRRPRPRATLRARPARPTVDTRHQPPHRHALSTTAASSVSTAP